MSEPLLINPGPLFALGGGLHVLVHTTRTIPVHSLWLLGSRRGPSGCAARGCCAEQGPAGTSRAQKQENGASKVAGEEKLGEESLKVANALVTALG